MTASDTVGKFSGFSVRGTKDWVNWVHRLSEYDSNTREERRDPKAYERSNGVAARTIELAAWFVAGRKVGSDPSFLAGHPMPQRTTWGGVSRSLSGCTTKRNGGTNRSGISPKMTPEWHEWFRKMRVSKGFSNDAEFAAWCIREYARQIEFPEPEPDRLEGIKWD